MSTRCAAIGHLWAAQLILCLFVVLPGQSLEAKEVLPGKSGQHVLRDPSARQLFLDAFAKAHGQGRERDLKGAVASYEAAANLGYAPAQYNLARMYLEGLGVAKNEEAAYLYFLAAAEKGLLLAQYNLGVLFETGLGTERDFERARYWYGKAAEQGDREAQYRLGRLYEAGERGVPRDLSQAVIWYTRSAEQGYAPAQNNLGTLYESGFGGVDKDPPRAVHWYHTAACLGHALAQYNLGQCYLRGFGVRQDLRKGQAWLKRARAQELVEERADLDLRPRRASRRPSASQVRERDLSQEDGKRIAVRIREVDGTFVLEEKGQHRDEPSAGSGKRGKKDTEKTAAQDENAQKASASGTGSASFLPPKGKDLVKARNLYEQALAFEKGLGKVDKDVQKACDLYQEAAKLNYAPACYRLGRLYEADRHLDADYRLAWKYFNQAAQGGHAKGQFRLGRLYEQGLGTPKNIALALYWYGQAKAQGDARAKQAFAQLSAE